MANRDRGAWSSQTPPPVEPDEYIHDMIQDGSRFRDDDWDYLAIRRSGYASRFIRFGRFPEGYREDVKLWALLQGRPHHPAAMLAGIVLRRRPASLESIVDSTDRFYLIARWGHENKLRSLSDWSQDDATRLIEHMQAGTHREGGRTNGPSSVRATVALLQKVAIMAPLAAHPLRFSPWHGQTAMSVAGEKDDDENLTKPLPWETWEPLMRAAATVIDTCSPLILEALRALRAARTTNEMSRGPGGERAATRIAEYLSAGGTVPLHTGFGRAKQYPRGQVNYSMFARQCGISMDTFKPTHHGYSPAATVLIADAVEGGQGEYGGLVPCHQSAWAGEIGLGEAEHLPSVLRAACYLLISALSGMRDSELQAVRRDALDLTGRTPLLTSQSFKRNGVSGQHRTWWVPSTVERALDALAELSQNDRLLARSGRRDTKGEDGEYAAARDISRLIAFVNARPDERPGRGTDLHLQPIRVPAGAAINSTSLRRSFAVYAATHPGAEIGVGIQLGKASLRATGGYVRDKAHTATTAITDERSKAVRADLERVLFSGTTIAGPSGDKLENLRVQVIADPKRAEQIIARAAQNYHLGIVNDCAYVEVTAACGPGGPKLATHFCASGDCANAVFHESHLPSLEDQLARYDRALDNPNLHPGLEANLRKERAKLVRLRSTLRTSATEEEM